MWSTIWQNIKDEFEFNAAGVIGVFLVGICLTIIVALVVWAAIALFPWPLVLGVFALLGLCFGIALIEG
jgi:hypothetical protein